MPECGTVPEHVHDVKLAPGMRANRFQGKHLVLGYSYKEVCSREVPTLAATDLLLYGNAHLATVASSFRDAVQTSHRNSMNTIIQ